MAGVVCFTMEHSIEFYRSVIRVIDYINPYAKDVWNVMPDKGYELAGDYWLEIGKMFKENHLGWFDHGQFRINKREQLAPLRLNCLHAIEKMEKEEKDRDIDRKYKIKGILFGGWGLGISILSLLISLVTLLSQLGVLKLLAK